MKTDRHSLFGIAVMALTVVATGEVLAGMAAVTAAACVGMTAQMSVQEVKCPGVQPVSGQMTPETSRLFEKCVDAVSGVVSYALSGGER